MAPSPDDATATSYHHGNLRTALLRQAEVSLAEVGVDGLTLRGLARDVGVSHGAPGRHFRDRQALLDALALDGFERLNAALVAATTTPGRHRDRFEGLIRAYVDFALAHPDLLQMMYAIKHHESASEQLREAGHRGLVHAQDLLRKAQAAGDLAPSDVLTTAVVTTAHVHGLALLAAAGMLEIPTEDAVVATCDLLWAGLRR